MEKAMKRKLGLWLGLALVLALSGARAAEEHQERGVGDVVYVPTPQIVVDEMLMMAKVGGKDFVIDLGSGDGRMVLTAAKKFGARGFGVDLSDDLLRESNNAAKAQGIADRAVFIKQNLFETDLSPATVITTYLLPSMNEKLRPKILSMKPGTRVVAHDYAMGDWHSDQQKTLDVPEKKVGTPGKSFIYLWIVPAKIAGRWQSQINTGAHTGNLEFEFDQRYQMFDGAARMGEQRLALRSTRLEADQISFQFLAKPGDNASRHEFNGTVKGDVIEGTLKVGDGAAQKQMPWSAKVVQRAVGKQ
jgi:Methyltransferase domain